MKKIMLEIFLFLLFAWAPEKSQVDPKKHCLWDGMNLGRRGLRRIPLAQERINRKKKLRVFRFSYGLEKKFTF